MMRVTLDAGGDGAVVSWIDDKLTISVPRAFAPGSPVKFVIAFTDANVSYEGRSIGSKKRDDGAFDVRMRMISMRREDKARLDSLNG